MKNVSALAATLCCLLLISRMAEASAFRLPGFGSLHTGADQTKGLARKPATSRRLLGCLMGMTWCPMDGPAPVVQADDPPKNATVPGARNSTTEGKEVKTADGALAPEQDDPSASSPAPKEATDAKSPPQKDDKDRKSLPPPAGGNQSPVTPPPTSSQGQGQGSDKSKGDKKTPPSPGKNQTEAAPAPKQPPPAAEEVHLVTINL
eukprot:jgi/Botrbrau1/18583/Bobra.0367s0025.1